MMTQEERNELEREHFEIISGYHDERAFKGLAIVVIVLAIVIHLTILFINWISG